MESHFVGQNGPMLMPRNVLTPQTGNFSGFNTARKSVGEKLLIMRVVMMKGFPEQLMDRMQEMESKQIALK